MRISKPYRVTRTFTQHLTAAPERVFPLLCPVREADWIDGWDPLLVLAETGAAEPGCVFVTPGVTSDAVWVITRHEPDNGLVEMVKFTPGVTVCTLAIRLVATPSGTDARVTYMHTSLGAEGDAFVDAFTEQHYEEFMRAWESRLNYYLETGEKLTEANGER